MQTLRMILRSAVFSGVLVILLSINPSELCAQTSPLRVRFLGPDDSTQRGVQSMQIGRDHFGATMLGVASNSAVAVLRNGKWSYQRPGYRGFFITVSRLAGFWFSPWEDSVLYMAADIHDSRNNEGTTVISRYVNGLVSERVAGEAWPFQDLNPVVLFPETPHPLVLAKAFGLFSSSTRGNTWNGVNLGFSYSIELADMVIARQDAAQLLRVGFASSPAGYGVEASSDTGRTWSRRSTFTSTMWGLGFRESRLYPTRDFLYMRSGVFVSDGLHGTALRVSDDEGRTWSEATQFPGIAGIAVDTAHPKHVYAVYKDTLCWSVDGGLQWQCASLGLSGARLTMAAKDPSANILYVSGFGNGVYAIEGIPTGSSERAPSPATTELGSPYPNPARGEVFIPVALRNAGPVLVTITDALGRRVATVHDGTLLGGMQQLRWNSAGMAKGVYVVRLACEGQMQVRRIAIE